jgi:hypothetical protein
MDEKVKVVFGEAGADATGAVRTLAAAMGDLDYVVRKLWVRVDELDGGQDAASVASHILTDSPTLKIQQFKKLGMETLDDGVKALETGLAGIKKERAVLIGALLDINDAARASAEGRNPNLKGSIIKYTKAIEGSLGNIWKHLDTLGMQ